MAGPARGEEMLTRPEHQISHLALSAWSGVHEIRLQRHQINNIHVLGIFIENYKKNRF